MIRRIFLTVLCLVWLTACTADDVPTPELTQSAEWQEGNASIVLSLPEDWAWNLFPETEEYAYLGGGIRFYPEDDPTADTVVRFANGLGVCGTDLETELLTLPHGTQIKSYTWGDAPTSLYWYQDTPGDYVAEPDLDDTQRKQYLDTVMQILDSAQLGGDRIRESTAIALTGHEKTDKNSILANFDAERNLWVVEIHTKETHPQTHIYTYEVTADGKTVIKTFDRHPAEEE